MKTKNNFWTPELASAIRKSQIKVRGLQRRMWNSKRHAFQMLRVLLYQDLICGGYRCTCGRSMTILSPGEVAAIRTAMRVLSEYRKQRRRK